MKLEKPNPRRPQLWYQKAHGNYVRSPRSCGSRVRILYPNGKAYWLPLAISSISCLNNFDWERTCYKVRPKKRKMAAIKAAMDRYDRGSAWGKAVFLGNL